MFRGTVYDIKRGILTFLYVVVLAHFLFSNIAGVIPRNFHLTLDRSSTSQTQATCAVINQQTPVAQDQKGFPFAYMTTTDCGTSNLYLLAGLLNVVYLIALTLIFILFRSNVLE